MSDGVTDRPSVRRVENLGAYVLYPPSSGVGERLRAIEPEQAKGISFRFWVDGTNDTVELVRHTFGSAHPNDPTLRARIRVFAERYKAKYIARQRLSEWRSTPVYVLDNQARVEEAIREAADRRKHAEYKARHAIGDGLHQIACSECDNDAFRLCPAIYRLAHAVKRARSDATRQKAKLRLADALIQELEFER